MILKTLAVSGLIALAGGVFYQPDQIEETSVGQKIVKNKFETIGMQISISRMRHNMSIEKLAQAAHIGGKSLQKIEKALKEAGAEMKHVVRTRMFVIDISKWEEAGRAHAEFFKSIKPAATMVEVKALIAPGLLIEIEVDAIVD